MGKKCAVARNSGPVVPLRGTMLEILLGRYPTARYVRLPDMPGCPELCPTVRLPGNMSGCPEIYPAVRYVRLSGCPELCPAARYARLSGCPELCPAARYARLSGCPVCPAVRLPGNMPNCPELCPECPASPASALRPRLDAQRQLSAAPLATSTDRHERRCATTPQDRAQLRGRASGVRCKAMLGRSDRKNDGMMPGICSFFYVTKACECCSKYTILFMIQKYVNDSQKCTTFSLPRY